MTHAEMLATAFGFEPNGKPEEVAGGGRCQITGEAIAAGYRCMDVAPSALNEFSATFNGDAYGWLSPSAAACLANDWNLGSRVAVTTPDGVRGYHVLLNRDQAEKQGRPYWSQLARDMWRDHAGWLATIVLASDVKKRVWHRARAGAIGATTPMLVHAPEWNVSEVRTVAWFTLLSHLDIIEAAYSAGFSKRAIATGLMGEHRKVESCGIANAIRHERAIASLRNAPEFLPALIMAQKTPVAPAPITEPKAQTLFDHE